MDRIDHKMMDALGGKNTQWRGEPWIARAAGVVDEEARKRLAVLEHHGYVQRSRDGLRTVWRTTAASLMKYRRERAAIQTTKIPAVGT
jgi:hypothetical protein